MRAASHICPVTLTPHRRLRNAFTCHQPINCGPFVLLGQHQLDFSWPLCAALSGPRLPASDPRELLRKDPLPSFFSGIRRCLRAPGLPPVGQEPGFSVDSKSKEGGVWSFGELSLRRLLSSPSSGWVQADGSFPVLPMCRKTPAAGDNPCLEIDLCQDLSPHNSSAPLWLCPRGAEVTSSSQ